MKQQLTLNQMAAELTRQAEQKRDYVASTRAMSVDFTSTPQKRLNIDGKVDESFVVAEHAHRQLAQRLSIPWKFYGRMLDDHPDLLERDVNALFSREPETRMVRTLDGTARAFLSNRFRRLDHYPLVETCLPILGEQELDTEKSSFAITATKMFMKVVFPKVQGEVRQGDVVQSGVIVTNSEVGAGTLRITPLVFRLVCTNGMVAPDSVDHFKRTHLGKELEVSGLAAEIRSDLTIQKADDALWAEVGDLTRATTDPAVFGQLVDRMRDAASTPIDGNPVEAVEILGSTLRLTQEERGGVLEHLVRGGDLTKYGMLNAVTRFAQDVDSFERSTELEEAGGKILDLKPSQWTSVAKAA
jgi:hypothetical protein